MSIWSVSAPGSAAISKELQNQAQAAQQTVGQQTGRAHHHPRAEYGPPPPPSGPASSDQSAATATYNPALGVDTVA